MLVIGWNTNTINDLKSDAVMQEAVMTVVVIVLLLGLMFWLLRSQVSNPIENIVNVMGQLAKGNTSVDIPFLEKKDEIGDMARGLEVFKGNRLEMDQMKSNATTTGTRPNRPAGKKWKRWPVGSRPMWEP
jgi:methyl-accepting chemotaxis protein